MVLQYIIQTTEYILPDTMCDVAFVLNVIPNKGNMQYYKHIHIKF